MSEPAKAFDSSFRQIYAAAGLNEEARRRLAALASAALSGSGVRRIRRSRRASTYRSELDAAGNLEVFIKVIDAPTGLDVVKRWLRRSPADHVADVTAALARDGFETPAILLCGADHATGREVIVTERAHGTLLTRNLRVAQSEFPRKRAMLRRLGAAIARLHRAGYLHGDLTPYNVFVSNGDGLHFVFIDHERTRRTVLSRLERPRMRNLVQLGRFKLNGLSRTDRMRVWAGYTDGMPRRRRRAALRRAVTMLALRAARDRATSEPQPARPAPEVRRVDG